MLAFFFHLLLLTCSMPTVDSFFSLSYKKESLITLYNVCAVPWGVLSTVGVFSTVGDIMSTVGGYLEYRGGIS